MVWPMKVGKMTDARDHDLTTFFSLRLFISSIRPRRRASMNGPFLTERDIDSYLPATCDAGTGRSDVRSSWTAGCDSPWRACPTGSWAASRSGTCLHHRRADGHV